MDETRSPYFVLLDRLREDRDFWYMLPSATKRAFLRKDPTLDWLLHRRPDQTVPWDQDWDTALFYPARGTGKTLQSSQDVNTLVTDLGYKRGLVVAPTDAMVRDTNVLGDDGIVACSRLPVEFKTTQGGRHTLTWSNGAKCYVGSAASLKSFRGRSVQFVLLDEFAFYEDIEAFWAALAPSIRPTIGEPPAKVIITTTPNVDNPAANQLLLDIRDRPTTIHHTVVQEMNRAIPASEHAKKRRDFIGGDIYARQEMDGEIILGGGILLIWQADIVAACSDFDYKELPNWDETDSVVIVDPAIETEEGGSNTALALLSRNDRDFYVRRCVSGMFGPKETRELAEEWRAQYNVGRPVHVETTQGGKYTEYAFEAHGTQVQDIKPGPKQGKRARALSIFGLYEDRRVKHVLPAEEKYELEREQKGFTGDKKTSLVKQNDRVDVVVYGLRVLGGVQNSWEGWV